MADVIKVRYEDLEAMKAHCITTARRLQETIQLAQNVAGQMHNGALVGDAGETFSDALKGPFVNSVNRLCEKFEEVAGDLDKVMTEMRQADQRGGSNFQN